MDTNQLKNLIRVGKVSSVGANIPQQRMVFLNTWLLARFHCITEKQMRLSSASGVALYRVNICKFSAVICQDQRE